MISPKEVKESSYSFVYEKNLPDKTTEFFWYIFKESVINAINYIRLEKKNNDTEKINNNIINAIFNTQISESKSIRESLMDKLDIILLDLKEKSNKLNQLQEEEKYDEIIIEIEKYIKWISRMLFLPHTNYYHFNIFITNLKRWYKWIKLTSSTDSVNSFGSNDSNDLNDLKNDNIKKSKHHNHPKKLNFDWLVDKTKDDFFLPLFNIRKYICEKNDNFGNEQPIIDKILYYISNYNINSLLINKSIIIDIVKHIFETNFFKLFILTEVVKYYPIVAKLKEYGILDVSIPDNFSIEKLFKKHILLF